MAGTSKGTDIKSKIILADMFPTSKICKLRFEYSTPKKSVDKQDEQPLFADQLEKEGMFQEIKNTLHKTTQLLLEDVNMGVVTVKNKETIPHKKGTKWIYEVKKLIHGRNKIYSDVLETGQLSVKILQDVTSEYCDWKASCHLSQDKQNLLVTSSDAGEVATIRRFIESKVSEIRAGETGQLSIQAEHSSVSPKVPEDKFLPSDTGPQNLISVSNGAASPCIASEATPHEAGRQRTHSVFVSAITDGRMPPNLNAELNPQVPSQTVTDSAADRVSKSTPQVVTSPQSPVSTRGIVKVPQVVVKLLQQQTVRQDVLAELESNGVEIDKGSISSGNIVVTQGDREDVIRALQSACNTLSLPVEVKDDVLRNLHLLQEYFPGQAECEADESGSTFRLAYHRNVEATVKTAVLHVTADWSEKGEMPSAAKADYLGTLSVPRNSMEAAGEETLGRTYWGDQLMWNKDFPESRSEPADLQTVTTNTMKTTGNTGNDGKEDATARQLDSKQMDNILSELEALQYLAGGNFAEVTFLNEKERIIKIQIFSQRQTLFREDVSVRDAEWGEVWKILKNPPKETKTFMKPLLSQEKLAVFSFDQESIMKVMRVIRAAINESRSIIGDQSDGPCRPEAAAGEEGQFCTSSGIEVYVYTTDITKLAVDAIVNAANGRLMHGGGVAAAISRAAGPELDEEGAEFVDRFGPLEVTDVLPTTSGNLPCKMVLHAVGPCWYDYKDKVKCTQDLQITVFNCLIKAHSLKLNSIAVSSISSAIFGVPEELCAEMYVKAVHEFERQYGGKTSLQKIHFVDVRDLMVRITQQTFKKMWKSDTPSDSAEKKTSQHIICEWGNNSSEDTRKQKWGGNNSLEIRKGEENQDTRDSISLNQSKDSPDSSRLVQNEDTRDTSRDNLDTMRQSHNVDTQGIKRELYMDKKDSSLLEYSRNTYTQDARRGYNYDTLDSNNQEYVRDNQQHDIENQEHNKEKQEHDRENQEHNREKQEHDRENQEHNREKQEHDREIQEHDRENQKHNRENQENDIESQEHDRRNQEHDRENQEHDKENQEHDRENQIHDRESQEHDRENKEDFLALSNRESQRSDDISRQKGREDTPQTKGSGQGETSRGRSDKGKGQKSGSHYRQGKKGRK